jgi:RNA polymerase sigma-70 factor, ECF subfamily
VIARRSPRIMRGMFRATALAVEGAEDVPSQESDGKARLEQMFRAHHELIWRTLRRLGLAPESAADATQQAFLIAAERLDDIRPGSERAFLFGTAVRLARTAFRNSRRFQLEDDMDLRPDPNARAEAMANRQGAREIADRILSRLDPDLLSVFILFELEGMSAPEISKLVGIPVGTVASRLRRAREAFRAEVAALETSMKGEKS